MHLPNLNLKTFFNKIKKTVSNKVIETVPNRHTRFIFGVILLLLIAGSAAAFQTNIFDNFTGRIASLVKSSQAEENIEPVISPIEIPEFAPRGDTPFKVIWQNVPDFQFKPLPAGKTVRVNLVTMKLYLYQDGVLAGTYNVLAKGQKGSYWETPGGEYRVTNKEEDHYSPNAKVWMPYAIQLFGNYFIHGWPYDSKGHNVAASYKGGDIRLKNEDIKLVYDFVDQNTVVSIFSDSQKKPDELGGDYYLKDSSKKVSLSSKSFLVADIDTGEIILSKDPEKVWAIASTTKLMTALTSLDVVDQKQITTITPQAVATYGVNGNFKVGERIKTSDLIYPLLLESSNDSAEIIADHVGRNFFMSSMNSKASNLGMNNTNYDDPSGLSAKNTSTASDLFELATYIYKNTPQIFEITRIPSIARSGHFWTNKGQFHSYSGYFGGKTGFTSAAHQTLVSIFTIPLSEFDNRHIAIILLQGNDRSNDVRKILDYLKTNVYYGQKELAPLPLIIDPTSEEDDSIGPISDAVRNAQAPETTLSFVGDIMLDRGVRASVNKNFAGDYNRLFDNLKFLQQSDILFGNLEGPVSDKGKNVGSKYSFRMDPVVIPALKNAGFDIVSFANNHVGDWTIAAFTDTLSRLATGGILQAGAGLNRADASDPRIIEVNGQKFGFLGASDVGPDWLKAGTNTAGILTPNDKDFDTIIKNAAAKTDFLIVSVHWGVEYQPHTTRQEAVAHQIIDDGADLVIGTHPHVIQTTEEYHGGLIAYSLGNFIFDQYFSTETMQGLLLQVRVKNSKISSYDKQIIHLNKLFQPENVTKAP